MKAGWCLALLMVTMTAYGEERDHFRHEGRGGWQGHDIRHFGRYDFAHWRGGRWYHARHEGRLGWWWVVGGLWYFYPAPIYPYPNPYVPPVVVEDSPPVVVEPPPEPSEATPPATVAPTTAQPQYWYFCKSANGYYPYVPACPEGWQRVPAVPPGAQKP